MGTTTTDRFAPGDRIGDYVIDKDLGDAYEHMDMKEYPYEFSSYSYRIAVNTFLYALSH